MSLPGDQRISLAVCMRKTVSRDYGWKIGKITPARHGRLWPRTMPLPSRWQWRSLALDCDNATCELVCLFQVNAGSAKFKAFLIEVGDSPGTGRLLVRCEHYPGRNGGLHVHTHCPDIPEKCGPETIRPPHRLPDHDAHHRRDAAVTRDEFFILACKMFRIDSPEAKQHSLDLGVSGGMR